MLGNRMQKGGNVFVMPEGGFKSSSANIVHDSGNGEEVKMSKRTGKTVTITELIDDLNISTENKHKLYSLNDELSNYSKLLDRGEMNFNISYFIKFQKSILDFKTCLFFVQGELWKTNNMN